MKLTFPLLFAIASNREASMRMSWRDIRTLALGGVKAPSCYFTT